MSEPISAMAFGDAISSAPGHAAQGVSRSRCVLADDLFLQGPSGLDRVEVRRVGGQVDQANALASAGRMHARVVVSRQIVHDEDIPPPQLRKQVARQPVDEAIAVRRGEHRREGDPAAAADRPEQGEVRPPVHRDAVDVLGASFHPRVTTAHRDVQARFVEEHEAIRRDPADAAPVRLPLDDHVRPQTLQWPSAFFFTT